MLQRALAGAALVLSLATSSNAARAAACCGAGHGMGQWLAPSERAAVSLALRGSERFGSWSVERDFAPSAGDSHDRELRADVGWLVRVEERVQLGITAPLLATWRGSRGAASSGGGVGDVAMAGRLELVERDRLPWLSTAALTLGVTLPTGRSYRDSSDPLAADATGLGVAELRPGLVLEKAWGASFQALLAASIGVRSRYHQPTGEAIHPAPRLQIVAAAGPAWPASGLSLTLGGLYEREGAPREDGRALTDVTRERTALLAVLAYDISARWTAIGNLQADVPISGVGRAETTAAALSAGVRYVWGRHD
ncbi:hypothetical protein SOCEGT47_028730 [Sorangium cellulosum]|uniref:Secreted protein n=1 Tax=Sorangium cellulosum TaxID=56 RepID=A0A4V0NDE3_SORCE|nr:hypothetical protein [Sorangium cellulosum]AUX22372.1 hypothetical protein SOCEGT47_028730 [Sorangium cellulosum]